MVCHNLGQGYSLTSNPGRTLWTPVGSSRIEGRRIGARGITRGLRLKELGMITALEILILSKLKCITLHDWRSLRSLVGARVIVLVLGFSLMSRRAALL